MKNFKITLAIVVMLSLAPAIFAGGNMEEEYKTAIPDKVETTTGNLPGVSLTYELSTGTTGIELTIDQWAVTHGLYRVVEDGITNYRKISDGSLLADTAACEALFAATDNPVAVTLSESSKRVLPNLADLKASKKSLTLGNLLSPFGSGAENELVSSRRKASFFYKEYGAEKEMEILLLNDEDDEYIRLAMMIQTEFFSGEYHLFSKYPEYNYDQKAMAFLGTLFQNGQDNEFQSGFDDFHLGMSSEDIPWTLFDSENPDLMRRVQDDFKRKFTMHMDFFSDSDWTEEYPVADTSALGPGLYGEKANIYLQAYLRFIYGKSKPVMSHVYSEKYDEEGTNTYNYANYQMLDEVSEGSVLAQNALRYYTWGVEYTPFDGYNLMMRGSGLNPVWKSSEWMGDVSAWTGSGGTGNRANNYLTVSPRTYETVTDPPKSPTFETNAVNKITLLDVPPLPTEGEPVPVNQLALSRIDLWSAENLAWRENLASPRLWRVPATSDPEDIAAKPNLTSLQDKTLILETVATKGSGNLNVMQTEVGTGNGIGVGYEFDGGSESVKALMVVRGVSPLNTVNATNYPLMTNPEAKDMVAIVYGVKNSEGGYDWSTLQPSEFIEAVTDNQTDTITFYPATRERRPGYGLVNEYFGRDEQQIQNQELVYSYFILNAPVNCDKIMVVDRSGNEFLNVSEMGVFSDDPLKHLNHEKVSALDGVKEIKWNTGEVTSTPAVEDLEGIMINGKPGREYSLTNDGNIFLTINAKAVAPVRHVAAWTRNGSDTLVLKEGLLYQFGDNSAIVDSEFFTPMRSLNEKETWDSVRPLVDTPFAQFNLSAPNNRESRLGNPLPYIPGGLDSPRTFAYKMGQQVEARKAALADAANDTTAALDNSYTQGYVDAKDFGASLGENKPFKPGYYQNKADGYTADTPIEASAGTDDLGLLQGALAMMDAGLFENVKSEDLTADLNEYYAMAMANGKGLDEAGSPLFQPTDDKGLTEVTRLTAADIERGSVIVPDVSLIQKGDLLVQTTRDRTHVGVVVGFLSEVTGTETLSELRNKVLVVSTRPGFQMTSLGTWGNPNGIFGGFTERPDEYVIRRLVKKVDSNAPEKAPSWELVFSPTPQWYSHYAEWGKVPEDYHLLYNDAEKELFQEFKTEGMPYYKFLPPTAFPDNRIRRSLFDPGTGGEYPEMRITNLSGWRQTLVGAEHRLSFHLALDVSVTSASKYFYAPEAGRYWIIDKSETSTSQYIRISEDEMLIVDNYGPIYGDIGVLATADRIYLFCHMEKDTEAIKNVFANNKDYLTAVDVESGDFIGVMGANSNKLITDMLAHLHIEVYERFPDYDPEGFNYCKKVQEILNSNSETVDEVFVRNNLKWQRIDPLSIFAPDIYYPASDYEIDLSEQVKLKLLNADFMAPGSIATQQEISLWFSEWLAPRTWEGTRTCE